MDMEKKYILHYDRPAPDSGECTVRYPGIGKMSVIGCSVRQGKDEILLQMEKGQSVTIQ